VIRKKISPFDITLHSRPARCATCGKHTHTTHTHTSMQGHTGSHTHRRTYNAHRSTHAYPGVCTQTPTGVHTHTHTRAHIQAHASFLALLKQMLELEAAVALFDKFPGSEVAGSPFASAHGWPPVPCGNSRPCLQMAAATFVGGLKLGLHVHAQTCISLKHCPSTCFCFPGFCFSSQPNQAHIHTQNIKTGFLDIRGILSPEACSCQPQVCL
jgi:hypothetical protein